MTQITTTQILLLPFWILICMSTLTSNYFETDSRALSLTRTHPIRKPIREKRENAKQTIAHTHSLSIQNQQKNTSKQSVTDTCFLIVIVEVRITPHRAQSSAILLLIRMRNEKSPNFCPLTAS